jgi:type I restriction enzyme S subunit
MTEVNDLPKDWKVLKLGDICQIVSGNTPKGLEQLSNKGDFQFYKVSDMNLAGNEIRMNVSNLKLTLEEIKNLKIKVYPQGTVIFPKRGGAILTNKKRILAQNASFDLNLMGILPNENVLSNFLYYWFQKLDLSKIYDGSNVPQINNKNVAPLDFPIPTIKEQQTIVSKIEELLSDLDNGKQQLQIAQQQLKVYRKALLMEGVTGKLTAKWRNINPNFDTSEKVFKKIQNHLDKSHKAASAEAIASGGRKPKDQRNNKKTSNVEVDLPVLPENWNYYRLEDISYLVTDGTHFTPKYQESGVKFLSVKNVRPFYFREEHVKYISEEEHKELIVRCNPQKDDILYTKVGATYGYAAKINMEYEFSIFVSLCLIKPILEYFSSDFLEMLMNSELIFQQARKRVSGSGVPDLHLIEIRDFKIPLPSLEEQLQIVYELESKLTVCDKIEETISQSLLQAETLRQSILKKAFEGKLVITEALVHSKIKTI